jgi:hypothetical protein
VEGREGCFDERVGAVRMKNFDALSRRSPAFRRLLHQANTAALSGDLEGYRVAHAAVLV